MEKNKTIKKILGGVLVGGMLLSSGIAFADTASDSSGIGDNSSVQESVYGQKGLKPGFGMRHFGMGDFRGKRTELNKEVLDQFVKDGVITQDKADEISAYIEKKDQERKAQFGQFKNMTKEELEALHSKNKADNSTRTAPKDIFTDLVSNNILTQEQADTLKSKLPETLQLLAKQNFADKLSIVVDKGIITQEQADNILQKYDEVQKERQAEFEKIKNMTPEERQELRKDNTNADKNAGKRFKKAALFTELVNSNIITQEQADSINTALKEDAEQKAQQAIADKLKSLVDKGTITQDQADKIIQKLDDAKKEREAQFDKIKESGYFGPRGF